MDDLHQTDPEARTLFGRPPGKHGPCLGCGLSCEFFEDRGCWLCVVTGQYAAVTAILPPHYAKRAETGDGQLG